MEQIDRDSFDDEIDLIEVSLYLWSKKNLILSITLIAAIFSVIFSLSLPNIYNSYALLAPANQEDSLKSRLGNFATFSNLAGIQIPNEYTASQEAMARIESFSFFSNNILPNIKLEDLMAVKKWVQEENVLVYDDKVFDAENSTWVREVSYPKKTIPSKQEAYEIFKETLSISADTKTSFVSVSIEHKSPFIAYQWLDIVIKQINESMRMIDMYKAQESIEYLNEKALSTNIQSTKDTISDLLKDQIQIEMLTSANDKEYIFKVIEAPLIAERKSKPSRAIICIIGTFIGGFFSIIVVFFQHLRESKINNQEIAKNEY